MGETADTGRAAGAPVLDPSRYPRTYRVSPRYRLLLSLLAAGSLASGLAGAWYFASGHEMASALEAFVVTALCLGFVLLGLVLFVYVLTTKVVLHADAIELHEYLRARRRRREEIAGWRILPAQYVSVLLLESTGAAVKPLRIPQLLATDEPFDAWFAGLPNLDVQQWEESVAAFAAHRGFGRTPEERLARVAAARKRGRVLSAVAVGVCLWGFAWPAPAEVVIPVLAALPLVALGLAACAGSLYRIVGHPNDARASLAAVFIGPGLVLGLRAFLDIAVLDWKAAVLLTLVAAAALALVIASVDRQVRERPWALGAALLFAAAYCYGALVEANALLDRSTVTVYEVKVLEMRASNGRATAYYLRLGPWGPRAQEEEVAVARELYEATRPGGAVCVVQRAGALGIGWYSVHACSRVHRASGSIG